MKHATAILLCAAILVLGFTGAIAQSRSHDRQPRIPGLVVATPFQALGNVIRNPDADRPHSNTARGAPVTPTVIAPGSSTNPQTGPADPSLRHGFATAPGFMPRGYGRRVARA